MQAMKVENMVKLKEEFDYKSLCRRLEAELDRMTAENERLVKIREDTEDECARQLDDARQDVYEAESKLAHALEVCLNSLPLLTISTCQMLLFASPLDLLFSDRSLSMEFRPQLENLNVASVGL